MVKPPDPTEKPKRTRRPPDKPTEKPSYVELWNAIADHVHYDPKTGLFTRLTKRGRWAPGSISGGVDTAGYRQVWVGGKMVLAHRLAWAAVTGQEPPEVLGFRDGVRSNTRWANLAEMVKPGPDKVGPPPRVSADGLAGVKPIGRRWRAQVRLGNNRIDFGTYSSRSEAQAAARLQTQSILQAYAHQLMARKEFSKQVRRDAFVRCDGHCEGCGNKLGLQRFQFDHANPDGLTGEPTLENCRVLCDLCHKEKTRKDITDIARAKRREDAHRGIRKPSTLRSRGFGRPPPQARATTPLVKKTLPRRNPWVL